MRKSLAPILLLSLLAAAFHLPKLDRPFGLGETTAGVYCGVFALNYRAHGFLELHGLPVGPQLMADVAEGGWAYRNHPPGIIWLSAIGSTEWGMRIPTVIGAALAAAGLFVLLRRASGTLGAFAASAAFLGMPALNLFTQVSYEPLVLAHGFWMWHATLSLMDADPTPRGRTGWRAVQILTALLGPWMDWSFVFFCAGLVPLVATRRLAQTARRLAVPATAAFAGVGLVLIWRQWALQTPLLGPQAATATIGTLWDTTIASRPVLTEYLRGAGHSLSQAATLPLIGAGLLGMALLARRRPRLALAALAAGVPQPLLFAQHASNHVHFFCYTGAALALGTSGLVAATGARRWLGIGALAVVATIAWRTSEAVVQQNATTFFRDAGDVLVEATHNEADPTQPVLAMTNLPLYAYYSDSPFVVAEPMLQVPLLQALRADPRFPHGFRYLWFKEARGATAERYLAPARDALAAWLGPLPKRRVPELEVRLLQADGTYDLDLQEVYVVDVPHRP
ncbi:MAG: hypothetical protein AAF628_30730 [Planctomycetota bacterium]